MSFDTRSNGRRTTRAGNVTLWIVQGLLALLFLFAGGIKLSMPAAVLAQQSGLPGPFMRFIAVAEILGALGLVLPGLLRIKRGLTPLAAAGLTVIMVGAVVVSARTLGWGAAVPPFVVGVLLVAVARGRRPWAGLGDSRPSYRGAEHPTGARC